MIVLLAVTFLWEVKSILVHILDYGVVIKATLSVLFKLHISVQHYLQLENLFKA